MHNLSVREIRKDDFEKIIDYFLKGDKAFLLSLGVDIAKLPKREIWLKFLPDEYQQPIENKKFYYITGSRIMNRLGIAT